MTSNYFLRFLNKTFIPEAGLLLIQAGLVLLFWMKYYDAAIILVVAGLERKTFTIVLVIVFYGLSQVVFADHFLLFPFQ